MPSGFESSTRIESLRLLLLDLFTNIEEENIQTDDFFFQIDKGFDIPELTFDDLRTEKKMIVIDGPNVAVRHGSGNFSCKGIRLVVNFFTAKGFEVRVVVPEQYLERQRADELKFKGAKANKIPTDLEILHVLDSQGLLIKTPPMDYDDSYCLQYAKSKRAVVISNDRF